MKNKQQCLALPRATRDVSVSCRCVVFDRSKKMQLWQGRFQKALDPKTNDFNSSIAFDSRMYKEDIDGSIAHATMLCAQNIISADDLSKIVDGLKAIKAEIENGTLEIDPNAEDIHTFVEGELTKRVGAAGKRLHTARSRNDQVALDVRLYLRRECNSVYSLVTELIGVLCKRLKSMQTPLCRVTLICSALSP